MRILPILFGLFPTVAAFSEGWSPRERSASESIQAAQLAAHTRFLADDLLEGRGAGARGDELAMRYIAAQYERLGLQPGGDLGSYYQKFEIVGLRSELVAPPTLSGPRGQMALSPPTDAIVAPGSQSPSASVKEAEIVFVGYGISAPEQRWDDFKGVDVRGKVLLVMNNDPADDPKLFAGKTRLYYGRWTYKYEEAARHGAAGVILIHTTPSASYPWQVVQSSWSGEKFELPAGREPPLQVKMWTTEEASRKLVALGGHDLDQLRRNAERRDFRPVPPGVKLTVALETQLRRLQTANVLGLLPGSDERLARELVVVTAHHDHLGQKGSAIYHGALDNASGVAELLALAESMSRLAPRPQRSVLFAAVGVEESGLLGSAYYCAHPTVPPERIAANLNIDGINIWGRTRDVTPLGFGKSSLDEIIRAAAVEQGRTLSDDPFPDRGHFYRSDQFSFAQIGVPSVYLGGGTDFLGHDRAWGRARIEEYERRNYHQPSDQIDGSWNLDGAVDDARLLLVIGLRVADAPAMPTWRPGDEFEKLRKR